MVLRIYLAVYICTYTVLEARKVYGMYCFVKYIMYVSVSGFFSQIRDLLVSINKW
jgi:hypothetical protein